MINKGLVLLIIGLFVIIFISACEPVPEPAPPPVTCDKPYILFEGACCLDANNNSICDKDEVLKQVEENKTDIGKPGEEIPKKEDGKIDKTV